MEAPLPSATHGAKVALTGLSALFLVLFVVPINLQSVLFGGAQDVPLVSLLMTWVRNQAIPHGWNVLLVQGSSGGLSEPTAIYAGASLALTAIIGYPLIAYAILARITPADAEGRRRKVYMLTSLASGTFLSGVFLGLLFTVKFYVSSLVYFFGGGPSSGFPGFIPAVSDTIPILAIVFTLSLYLFVRVRFSYSK